MCRSRNRHVEDAHGTVYAGAGGVVHEWTLGGWKSREQGAGWQERTAGPSTTRLRRFAQDDTSRGRRSCSLFPGLLRRGDDAAGDAVAGVAGGVGLHVVGLLVDHDGGAAVGEDGVGGG